MSTIIVQDIGTTAILLLVAISIVIRARYFCTYGKEAFGVVIGFVLCVAPFRYAASHDWISADMARMINGYLAVVFAIIQASLVYSAELTHRAKKRREHFHQRLVREGIIHHEDRY